MKRSVLVSLFLAPLVPAQITCFIPNGQNSTHSDTQICNSLEGGASMCCGPNDICLNNGLCKARQSPDDEGSSSASYWRDTCSSYPWPEVGCLRDICTVCFHCRVMLTMNTRSNALLKSELFERRQRWLPRWKCPDDPLQ